MSLVNLVIGSALLAWDVFICFYYAPYHISKAARHTTCVYTTIGK